MTRYLIWIIGALGLTLTDAQNRFRLECEYGVTSDLRTCDEETEKALVSIQDSCVTTFFGNVYGTEYAGTTANAGFYTFPADSVVNLDPLPVIDKGNRRLQGTHCDNPFSCLPPNACTGSCTCAPNVCPGDDDDGRRRGLRASSSLSTVKESSKSHRRLLLGECEGDCDRDSDCGAGLLCADEHKNELDRAGYDERKANCGDDGSSKSEVCFRADLLGNSDGTIDTKLLGECEVDCDKDSDCGPGLLCADEHKQELAARGLDPRKADCGDVGNWHEEVCFPESELVGVNTWALDLASDLVASCEEVIKAFVKNNGCFGDVNSASCDAVVTIV